MEKKNRFGENEHLWIPGIHKATRLNWLIATWFGKWTALRSNMPMGTPHVDNCKISKACTSLRIQMGNPWLTRYSPFAEGGIPLIHHGNPWNRNGRNGWLFQRYSEVQLEWLRLGIATVKESLQIISWEQPLWLWLSTDATAVELHPKKRGWEIPVPSEIGHQTAFTHHDFCLPSWQATGRWLRVYPDSCWCRRIFYRPTKVGFGVGWGGVFTFMYMFTHHPL